jgi:hypothetical protein
MGDTNVFNDKLDIYNNFVELHSAENRQGIDKRIKQEKRKQNRTN